MSAKGLFGGAIFSAGITAAALAAPTASAQCTPTVGASLNAYAGLPVDGGGTEWNGGLVINGDRLYVEHHVGNRDPQTGISDPTWEIDTWDISNPSAPTRLAESTPQSNQMFDNSGRNVVAIGTNLIGIRGSGIRFYSMADPMQPALLSTLDLPGSENELFESGGLLYVHTVGPRTLYIVDPTDPQAPFVLDSIDTGGHRFSKPVNGVLAVAVNSPKLLTLYDVTDPTNVTEMGTAPLANATPFSVTIIGATAVIPSANSTMQLIDISDPTNPAPLPAFPDPFGVKSLNASGLIGFGVDDFSNDFHAIDFSDPLAPFVASTIDPAGFSGSFRGTQALDGGVFAWISGPALQLIDVSDCALLPFVEFTPGARITDEGAVPETLTLIVQNGAIFEWSLDGVPVSNGPVYSGSTTASLTIESVPIAEGVYTCVVSNGDGVSTSQPIILGVRTIGQTCPSDLNGDGIVDTADLGVLLGVFGSACN